MRTNSPTKIMAVDYTPAPAACGPAPGIWTLTEIAQRLSRAPRQWPKSLLTVKGPTEYTNFNIDPVPDAAIDILLKCRTTTAISTGNALECDTYYDYSAGVQWEVSKDYGASWQPLDNKYNLSSQKISIGQRIRAEKFEDDYFDVPLPLSPLKTDGLYQFYGYIDSVRLSIGVPRYTEDVVTPFNPNAPDSIDAATYFALNLGAHRGGVNDVGNGVNDVYAVARPLNTQLGTLPHAATLQSPWFKCQLDTVTFTRADGGTQPATRITTVNETGQPIAHNLLSRASTGSLPELLIFRGDVGVDDGTSSFSPTGLPVELAFLQKYEIVNFGFTATTFCIRDPDDVRKTPPIAVVPWNFAPAPESTPPIYVSRAPVFNRIIGAGSNVQNRPPLASCGGLKYGNLEDGLPRPLPLVSATVADESARDALPSSSLFVGMCVQTGTGQNANFWVRNSANTWDKLPFYSPPIQFLTRESNYLSNNDSDSTYLIFDDSPRYGWPFGQFKISPEQKDFCLESYFKVTAFRHSLNGVYAAEDNFRGVIVNTQSWETKESDKISGDGVRIYVTPQTQETYCGADNDGSTVKIVAEDDIGNLFVDVGRSRRALRFYGLHANQFHHVAVSRQVDTFRLYVNGVKVDELVLQDTVYEALTLDIDKNHYRYRAAWTRGALRANTSPAITIQVTIPTFFFTLSGNTYPASPNTTVMDDAGWIEYSAISVVLNSGKPIKPQVDSAIPERDTHVYVVEDSPSATGDSAIVTLTIKAIPYITFQNPLPVDRDDFVSDNSNTSFDYVWQTNKSAGTGLSVGYTDNGVPVAGTLVPPNWGSAVNWVSVTSPEPTGSGGQVSLSNYIFNTASADRTVLRVRTVCSKVFGYGRNIVLRGRTWLEPLRAVFGITPTQSNRDIAATLRHRVRVATTSVIALSHTGSGHPVIDGVTLAPGDLILVKNAVDTGDGEQRAELCGIYVYENAEWVTKWRRANLLSTLRQFTPSVNTIAGVPQSHVGMRVEVLEGAENGGNVFRLVSSAYNLGAESGLSTAIAEPNITLGTTEISFQPSTYSLAGVTVAEPVIPVYTAAANTITIRFSKPLADNVLTNATAAGKLTLTYRAGGTTSSPVTTTSTFMANQITSSALVTNGLFTVNLNNLATASGLYTLKLNHVASEIVDASANPLVESPEITWIVA